MLIELLKQIPAILFAISVHEFGHALAAYAMGDETAKEHGRMTLDPIKHIDKMGLLVLVLARFGWAKPVPINENNFKNKRVGMIIVSLAGPAFNLISAAAFLFAYKFEVMLIDMYALNEILAYAFKFNVLFAAFNLIPIPPLDGSKILVSILPRKAEYYFWEYENIGMVILIALIFTDKIGYLIYPIAGFFQKMLFMMA